MRGTKAAVRAELLCARNRAAYRQKDRRGVLHLPWRAVPGLNAPAADPEGALGPEIGRGKG